MSENNDQYNRGGMLAFLFSMAFVFAFMFYLVFIHPGVQLNEKVVDPKAPKVEGAKAEFDISTVSEPWVSTPEIVAYGEKLYQTNCSMCHGPQGKGDGPAGGGLNPPPRNFVEGKWKVGPGLTDRFKAVSEGNTLPQLKGSSMAPFGTLKSADRWALVNFIDSISQNKSKEDSAKVAAFAKSAK